MSTVEELNARIKQLEAELADAKKSGSVTRKKIDQMSSEVVDSNPYRFDVFT